MKDLSRYELLTTLPKFCYKIELIPDEDAPVVWGKVILWISKSDYLQLKTEFYDEDDYLVNVMKASKIKEMGGKIIPTYLEMVPVEKKGHKTMKFYRPIQSSGYGTSSMIANELITEKEMKKRIDKNVICNKAKLDLVEVKKNNTYWAFGARFECGILNPSK